MNNLLTLKFLIVSVMVWNITNSQNVTTGRWCIKSQAMSAPAGENMYAFIQATEGVCGQACFDDATCGCYLWSPFSASGICMMYHGKCPVTGGTQGGGMCDTARRNCVEQNIALPAQSSSYAWNGSVAKEECMSICQNDVACHCFAWEGVDGVNSCTRYREKCVAGPLYGGNCEMDRTCVADGTQDFMVGPDSFVVIAANANCEAECRARDTCSCWVSGVDRVCFLYEKSSQCLRGGNFAGGSCIPVVEASPRPSRAPSTSVPTSGPTPKPVGPPAPPTASPTTQRPTSTPTVTGHRTCVTNDVFPFEVAPGAQPVQWIANEWLNCQSHCQSNQQCACYMPSGGACVLYPNSSDCVKGLHGTGKNPQWGGYCGTGIVTVAPTPTPCCSGMHQTQTNGLQTCGNFDYGMCLHWEGCTWTCAPNPQ